MLIGQLNGQEKYSVVEFTLKNKKEDISALIHAGFEMDHIHPKGNKLVLPVPEFQWPLLLQINVENKVLFDDYSKYISSRIDTRGSSCDCPDNINTDLTVPRNFELGSMGGFFTYSEMLDQLDLMQLIYPNLISRRQGIGNFRTAEGREIFRLIISDNPESREPEKKILFTGLHHAREPMSLSQMIYFMWYLLENYSSSEEIRNLIDNTEIYFVPCVNPDGYQYNCQNLPLGGGMWRKNRRQNSDGSKGVDLNRNYGYGWGRDNTGSSPMPESLIYRGTAPFSEPETQAIKFLCESNHFELALNYHSYGNLLVHPSNFEDPIADSTYLRIFASHLSAENHFKYGSDLETVGYSTNGSSDDWMFAEELDKNKILSFTPEVGCPDDEFWPKKERIYPNCHAMLETNLKALKLAHSGVYLEKLGEISFSGTQGTVSCQVKNIGKWSADISISAIPLSSNIKQISSTQALVLESQESKFPTFDVVLDRETLNGDQFAIIFRLIQGNLVSQDTLYARVFGRKILNQQISNFNMDQWNGNATNKWNKTTTKYFSQPDCITDSPSGHYESGASKSMTFKLQTPLTGLQTAELTYMAQWSITTEYDYAQVSISTDGLIFAPVKTSYTKPGSIWQKQCEEVYDGYQNQWIKESINLQDYLGGDLYLKLDFSSNLAGVITNDGFYIDDIQVTGFDTLGVASTKTFDLNTHNQIKLYPNPTSKDLNVQLNNITEGLSWSYSVKTIFGKDVTNGRINASFQSSFDVSSLPDGPYILEVFLDNGERLNKIFLKNSE